MSVKIIHRPARTTAPAREAAPFSLEAPPPMAETSGRMNAMALIPLLGAGLSMTVMMLFRGNSLAAVGAIAMIVTVVASIIMMLGQRGRAARSRAEERDRYLEYLEESRATLRTDEQRTITTARTSNPEPTALFDIVRNTRRLWERRRGNEDFLQVRIGSGERISRQITVNEQGPATAQRDTFMDNEVRILQQRYERSPDLPLTLPLDSAGNVSIIGSREFALNAARNLLIEACAFHSPEDLEVAIAAREDRLGDWNWALWLPHLADQKQAHATGPVRRMARSVDELGAVLADELNRRAVVAAESSKNLKGASQHLPRLLVLADCYGTLPEDLVLPDRHAGLAQLGITVVYLVADRGQEPGEVSVRVSQDGAAADRGPAGSRSYRAQAERSQARASARARTDRSPAHDARAGRAAGAAAAEAGAPPSDAGFLIQNYRQDPVEPVEERGTLDGLAVATAEALARGLAPMRLSADSLEHNTAASSDSFLEMLGLSPALDEADIRRLWKPRSEVDFLRIPLGPDDRGRPALLDLKESAQFGMGPHGLCVGATGSGKSEMLRSLVLGLLATHPPELLSMVLVDFKGGATFAPFADAPQVSGVITNLADDASLIERIYSSLNGEVIRRQEVLKAAGNIANITDYHLHRQERLARGEAMAPLPHLVVIIDEFGELLTARPDFIDLFLSIGRIGRSIGLHLLLSSQRIESGKLRGLETYLSYRIGLRTLSESESRTVLDTPDAFHLPPVPGFGYLKVDTTVYTRFKAGYVSGPLEDVQVQEAQETTDGDGPLVLPMPTYAASLEKANDDGTSAGKPARTGASKRTTGPTVMSTLMDTLARFPRAVDPIWLPPLPAAVALDTAAGSVTSTSQGIRLTTGGSLKIPVGLLDDPAKQWQGVWELDLKSAGGNVAIIGGPQSGKSTALRTIAASLAITHSPQEVGIYCVDLLGNSLIPLEGLPHVGGVAVRTNREVVRRTVEELLGMLTVRENVFEKYQVDSLATLRKLCAQGRIPELPSADIVLVLDGYGLLTDEFDDIEPAVHALIARGGGYGIHVVTTANRQNEIRLAQQSFFGTKIELRLADPADSSYGRKLAETMPADRPGRALTDAKLFGHFALPRIDGVADADTATQGARDMVAAVAASTDARAMRVRILPQLVEAAEIKVPPLPGLLPLGLRETDLGPEMLDIVRGEHHLIVMGDEQSGKTNAVRSLVSSLVAQYPSRDLVFAVFDPRRALADVVPDAYLGGYAPSAAQAEPLANAIASELSKRTAGGDAMQDSLGEPDSIPRIVLLADDYDILTAGGAGPLRSLIEYLPMGPELQLNVILTRRVRGAGRGMYEQFFAALRDSGSTGLILSGDRSEGGLLNNVRARRLPPGRGLLVRSGGPVQTVQTLWTPMEATADV
ncbi:type VII secretion protein EccCa [Arthrobacter sp.]|uniref:type VII secretion protein EccCa n=1 Tax=Arthrobacter sp. TaxID=1667 RepID=UPI003397D5BF